MLEKDNKTSKSCQKQVEKGASMVGITSFGAYIPRLRLERQTIYQAMGWFAPALMTVAQGERSMGNWDEDSLTMAVSACLDCIRDKKAVESVSLASTTFPFSDRQNAGVAAAALNLSPETAAVDVTGSQKAGMTALRTALETAAGGRQKNILVAAADCRRTRPGSFQEMWYGDGAAALQVGDSDVLAEYLGSHTLSCDFNDHFRGELKPFDTVWEERWSRDEGYTRFIPEAFQGLLDKTHLAAEDVSRVVFPCVFTKEFVRIAGKLGIPAERVADNLHESTGETGCAHALLMLVHEMEKAEPGEVILALGYGHGCEALAFRVTDRIREFRPGRGVRESLKNRKLVDNYTKYLVFRQLVEPDMGLRGDVDQPAAMSVLWRKNAMLLGLVGGECTRCGLTQFPKQEICVNPECGAEHSLKDVELAGRTASIKTYTGDMLAASLEPPHAYGMIEFQGGGRMMADFTDCGLDELQVGLPMEMVFRIRVNDGKRGFKQYFWKARPVPGAQEALSRLDFSGQVAVVTGAGGGLGRVYALELARRGAHVVVNDLGSRRDGTGASSSAADAVVKEIREAGGEAVADYEDIALDEGGRHLIKTALDAFGRVDVLINNAGILRDKTLARMAPEDWQAVLGVHLHGAYHVTRAAMEVMRTQGYGRVVMTTSGAGLYGNFGQTSYAAAKMALVGLMNTLKLEGSRFDIKVNTVAPLAASRLTEDIMPPELFARMKPEYVAPLVLYLSSRECECSGQLFNCGLGAFNRAALATGQGVRIGDSQHLPTVEQVAEHFDRIRSLDGSKEYTEANEALMDMFG
jgi:3-hydroxy-3-methylglutaryl CoA synthase/NAD(P)-dependent dehydrogenase (short-subunit alcohol dehydrogenase family)